MGMITSADMERAWCCSKQVLPQHTDHAGVLWHGAYVAWLEEARVEALDRAGLAYADLSATGLELMVTDLQLHYRQALLHGERVNLLSRVLPARGVRLPFCTQFRRSDGGVAAEAVVQLVLVDRGRARVLRRPPVALAAALERLAAGSSL
jgi:acyl-CoA thioester hydrolase